MNARARLVAGFVPALLAAGACQSALEGTRSGIAISNVTVIDAVSGERPDQTVLIDGDRIAAVGASDSIDFGGLFEVIDGAGKFLIPGLWDMHVHLTYDERLVNFMPRAFIRYGITSVRDTGGLMRKLRPVVERMRAAGAIAPRVFFSGPLLDTMRNTIQVPTARLSTLKLFPVFERGDWAAALARMPPALIEEWSAPPAWMAVDPAFRDHRFAQYTLDMIGRMRQAGVPIGAGTDTPLAHAIPGYSLHNELEILVAAGLTPLEALGAATIQPAAFFSLQDEIGAVAPGMHADLVLLRTNPLADIRNTRSIDRVIARGRLMPTE